jgi:hypothetical protein
MTVEELITTWGFDIKTKPITELKESLAGVRETVLHLGELIAGEGASLFGLTESTADAAVGFKRTAEEVGTTTDMLQGLSYVAKQWDLSNETVRMGLRHLSTEAVSAIRGQTEAMQNLSQVGITTLTDSQGHLLRSDQLMAQVARHFQSMPNDIMKAGLAMKVFGRGGSDVIPLLNRWDEVQKTMQEGRELGVIISPEQIEKAELFKESMNRIRAILTGLRTELGVALMPALEDTVTQITKWYMANRDMIQQNVVKFAEEFGSAMQQIFHWIVAVLPVLTSVVSVFGGLANVLALITAGFVVWTGLGLITSMIQMVKVVQELAEAFRLTAIWEAFASGGANLLAGAAVLGLAGGAAYFGYKTYQGLTQDYSKTPAADANKWGGTPTPSPTATPTAVHLEQMNQYTINAAPGTTAQQAADISKQISDHQKSSLRMLAGSVASPANY